jgi:two-component system chemotaxis sensor kinase CheA
LSESLTAAYRALHSLKGNAGFMGFADIERLTHRMETALDSMRSGEIPPDADNVGILLSLLDVLRQAARSAAEEEREDIENCEVYVELLEDSMPALRQVADSPPVAAAEVRSAGDGGQSPGETAATKSAPRRTRQDVRVDIAKLDALVNLVGELVIAEAMVTRHPHVAEAAIEGLDRAVHMLRRVSSDLQDVAMSTRMVPLTATFRKMIRLVHDLAGKAGKQIELQLLGEETEVDKTVIEQITDPLIHIVRNAADHGIEAPDERRAAGKGEQAMITIEGRHEGGEVWILITDDGRGLDRQKILRKAKENGLVAGEAEEWPDSRVFRLIFEPGFSTAEQVTDISGRGVGMDVVKKNLERLNGKIDVRSAPGRGSTFVMRIPLTMAIIEGMLVRVGSARYTVPMLAIRESFRPEPGWITTTPDGQEAVRLREDFYPVLRLHERFAKPPDSPRLEDGILVLVEGEQQTIALFVDEILGQQETVIKGLSQFLVDSEGVSGCTILGDGEVSLILDIAGLVSERAMAAR